MLEAALSSLELRYQLANVTGAALPRSIPLSTTGRLGFDFTVPPREHWMLLAFSAYLLFDSASLSVARAVFVLDAPQAPSANQFTAFPVQITNMISVTEGYVSVLLPGIEAGPSAQLRLVCEVTNSDGVAAHNIISGTHAQFVVRPLLMVSEIAIQRMREENADVGLRARLRR